MSETGQTQGAEENKPLLKTLPVYPDACCYGCFKMYPREQLTIWLCEPCIEKRAAEAEARKAEKAAEKSVTN